jgi:hypothetical protein
MGKCAVLTPPVFTTFLECAAFGSWNLPVNFKQTPTGGSCSPGCPGTYTYDRQLINPGTKPGQDK